ncbi:MAG: peroxiredoxin [Desulfuromonas sp.]|nr:peroxiredoxin [Desulfuromonas sp.]
MAEELAAGCERPTGGPVFEPEIVAAMEQAETPREEKKMIMVGQKVPDFTAPGYLNGQFADFKLSDYYGDGKWAVLCFYPGDFTFV